MLLIHLKTAEAAVVSHNPHKVIQQQLLLLAMEFTDKTIIIDLTVNITQIINLIYIIKILRQV